MTNEQRYDQLFTLDPRKVYELQSFLAFCEAIRNTELIIPTVRDFDESGWAADGKAFIHAKTKQD